MGKKEMAVGKYDFKLDLTDPLRKAFIEAIKPASRILEFGPATGFLTQYLQQELHCRVDIVELDPSSFRKASLYAERSLCGDIETLAWEDTFSDTKYQYILFADVLEHLKEPAAVLNRIRPLLAEDGRVIISVPNISYAGVVMSLLEGKFLYTETGILDDTHLRFFTQDSLCEMLRQAHYEVEALQAITKPIAESEFHSYLGKLNKGIEEWLIDLPEGFAYQYLLVAGKQNMGIKPYIYRPNPCLLPTTLYYRSDDAYTEEKTVHSHFLLGDCQSVTFTLPPGVAVEEIRWEVTKERCVLCKDVCAYFDNGMEPHRAVKANRSYQMDEWDVFMDPSPSYLFAVPQRVSTITIQYSLELDYGARVSAELVPHLLQRCKYLEVEHTRSMREYTWLSAENAQRAVVIQGLQGELKACGDTVYQQQEAIQTQMGQLNQLSETIHHMQANIDRLEEAMATIQSSFSWRLTRPLRMLADKWHRRKA